MEYIRSRPEQLAQHLREQLRAGELAEPLPNTRAWAARLGVSCETLYAALHVLEHERLLTIRPRQGVFLRPAARPARAAGETKIVRIVYHGTEYPGYVNSAYWLGPLGQQLQRDGIQLQVENCTHQRISALCDQKRSRRGGPKELLLLQSLSTRHQLMFSRSGQACLILGYRAPGVDLPFVVPDFEGAIRHATHLLLRAGLTRLHLLIRPGSHHAVQRQRDAFHAACAAWPRQPVAAEILAVPVPLQAQLAALNRFAGRLQTGHGLIVVSPLGIDAVMTSLYAHGIALPRQARLVFIEALARPRPLAPMPVWYAASQDAWVKRLAHDAAHFFATGQVPASDKTLALEIR